MLDFLFSFYTQTHIKKRKVTIPLILLLASPQHSSQGSRDGYFEMSLDESVEETVCSFSPSLAANELSGHQGEGLCAQEEEEEEEAKEEDVKICRVLWCYCLQVEEEEVQQREACLVLCDQLVGLLFLPGDSTWTGELKGKLPNGNVSSYLFRKTYKYIDVLCWSKIVLFTGKSSSVVFLSFFFTSKAVETKLFL